MDKKEEILEAMTELFAQKGYNTSMSDISKKVGIKVQSIYSHYESKDQIVYLVLKKEINSKFDFLYKIILESENMNSEKALKNIYLSIIDYFNDYKNLNFWRNISFIQNDLLRIQCRDKISQCVEKSSKGLLIIFQKGVKNGKIKNVNIEGDINLYIAMVAGILDGMLLYHGYSMDMKAYAIKTWDAYWEGIRA